MKEKFFIYVPEVNDGFFGRQSYCYMGMTEEEANKKASDLAARGYEEVYIGKLVSKVERPSNISVVPIT